MIVDAIYKMRYGKIRQLWASVMQANMDLKNALSHKSLIPCWPELLMRETGADFVRSETGLGLGDYRTPQHLIYQMLVWVSENPPVSKATHEWETAQAAREQRNVRMPVGMRIIGLPSGNGYAPDRDELGRVAETPGSHAFLTYALRW